MFEGKELKDHLLKSDTISSQSVIVAEWNMNIPGNVQKLGNYRNRKQSTQFSVLTNFFDVSDSGGIYTNATDADVLIDSGFVEQDDTPISFKYPKDKEKIYYSLEDCLKPFRPRSGINKLTYFSNRYLPSPDENMFLRPRYYMSSRDDEFKYWRSYRTESLNGENGEYGVSKNSSTGVYEIDDAVPFVVYKESVPANRLVVKLQTNVGSINQGPFRGANGSSSPDPLFGDSNKSVPSSFKVQYLDDNNQWLDAISFESLSLRADGISPIFGVDGHISLEYGLKDPYQFSGSFRYLGQLDSELQLPAFGQTNGDGYLITLGGPDRGLLYTWNSTTNVYDDLIPEYSWTLGGDETNDTTRLITKVVDPSFYGGVETNTRTYREFVMVKGIRLVVNSMNTPNTPLELIEFSPRLVVDISGYVTDFSVSKTLSDLSGNGLPVGQLLASTGTLNIFDYEEAFNENNPWDSRAFNPNASLISKYLKKNVKFVFYELIKDVQESSYYVPIKTFYSEGVPQISGEPGKVSLQLRDFFFYLESIKAPQILLTEVSLSQAVCLLLDSIGFSNYSIKRLPGEKDAIIPYFFVAPNQNVAEVLSQLAVATQSAMFFDEYNNFIVMTKGYMLDEDVRPVDLTLRGEVSFLNGQIDDLVNIISVASKDKKVFNAGSIDYTTRYIQRTYGTLQQSLHVDKSWIYKPSLLWEVSGTEKTTTANAEKQEKFALGAMPLNSNLSDQVPTVVNGEVINNLFDVGENSYWITRFKGFFYSNAEIIKYDAVEYSITGTGNVFISDNLEYQRYFSKLPFNGKIYPTGRIRIYSEPYYETKDGIFRIRTGAVVSHGRGQFGTNIVEHRASIDPYWTNVANVQGCNMESKFLYNTDPLYTTVPTESGAAGVNPVKASKSQRNGIIKNFLSSNYATETDVSSLKSTTTGTLQSSALVFTGPSFNSDEKPQDFVSYVYKPINKAFKHFGTRLRIIGKVEANGENKQSPVGGMNYFTLEGEDPTKTITVGGGSGGISLVDSTTNNGYYFEIAALTSGNIEQYLKKDDEGNPTVSIQNLLFYKIQKEQGSEKAIPVKLWGGIGNVVVDDGNFVGQYRFMGEDNPTVYDIAIEYTDINQGTRVFYLYVNQRLVKTIVDTSPLKFSAPSIGLFVRGTSKLMFENIYALGKNYAQNTVFDTNVPLASVFGDDNNQVNAIEALQKYAISGVVQNTYLSNIDPSGTSPYDLYYEEFGTIMRECAYFNIKYDRAYPAIYAKIAPTFNRLRGYTVSGFTADSYGAEFLVFNNTDTILNLDETTGNYLRILGVTFTQDTTNTLTVDDYFKKRGNLSDPELRGSELIESPLVALEQYDKLRVSRLTYGQNEFSIKNDYIQDQDAAEDLLGWIINKNLRPRKAIGLEIFPIPTLQLGDLVNISYSTRVVPTLVDNDVRFVVYNISYGRNSQGPSMTVYLSEV